MCTWRKRLKETLHVLVHQGMLGDALLEIGELLSIWQIAVDEQVGNLEEGSIFCQLFDGISPVAQNPLLTIEEGNGTLG